MNERIRELFDQARAECFKMGSKPGVTVGYDDLEKFAELIVQECILSIYRSDISDKKQERLVQELAYKFGFGGDK